MEETKNLIKDPKYFIFLILVVGVIALGALSILRDRIVNPERNYFNVSAEGKVLAKPDIAQISFGVQGDTKLEAVEAVEEGTAKMNAVITELKGLGIEEKDIKSTQYSLNPIYSYNRDDGKRSLDGYELYQQLTIKVRDLDKIGEAIKVSANAGANQIGGVNFTIDDTDELKAEARQQAITKAKEKAQIIATESGLKLGKLTNVYENDYQEPIYRNDYAYAKEALGMGGSVMEDIPDVESGEMEVKLNVTLTYRVK